MPEESTTPDLDELTRRQHGRPGRSSLAADERGALIAECADGRVARLRLYVRDIDEARPAAERLCEERG